MYRPFVVNVIKTNASARSNFPIGAVARCFSTESVLQLEVKDHVQWIRLNRPKQFNAINTALYESLTTSLKSTAENPNVKLTVITGNGKFFSSGNDLNNFAEWQTRVGTNNFSDAVDFGCDLVERFVEALIDYPKPLIGVVNGPAFGIMATTLALYDTVLAADTATFTTPFTSLAQAPEGCSTYLFPRILGPSLASEMLLFSQTLSIGDAHRTGFVSRVLPAGELESHVNKWLYDPVKGLVATCYPNSMMNAKALVRNEATRNMLKQINKAECESLKAMFQTAECKLALERFFQRKRK